jgi:predicted dehydrogenase
MMQQHYFISDHKLQTTHQNRLKQHPRNLKIGIAGFGIVGKRRKACLEKISGIQIVAICDRDIKDSYFDEKNIYHCNDINTLFSRQLDALIVCLTNDVAAKVTINALKNGLHVFCEKPPGKNIQDIRDVIKEEKLHPEQKLMYGFNHRYHDSIIEAMKIMNTGKLGKIINMRGVYGKAKLITFNQPTWRTKRDIAGGGVLLDQGIHMVDLMRLFAGEFIEVNSIISNSHWGYDVEDNAYALMKTANGVVAMLNSSATQWRHQFQLDINLEKGSLILDGLVTGTKSYGAESLTVIYADPDNDMGNPIEHTFKYNKDPSWDREMHAFVDNIFGNQNISHGSSSDALSTMQLVNQIYYADRTWREKFNITET